MPAVSAHQALRDMASRAPAAQNHLEEAARQLEAALGDADGVVGVDEHFKVTRAVIDAQRYMAGLIEGEPNAETKAALQKEAATLEALAQNLFEQGSAAQGWFRAYTPLINDGQVEIRAASPGLARPAGGTSDYATYMTRDQWEAALGPDYEMVSSDRPDEEPLDIDGDDYIYSSVRFRHRQSGVVKTAHQLFGEAKLASLRNGELSISSAGSRRGTQHRMLDMLNGAGALPRETFDGVQLPSFLSDSRRDVEGVRLAWVVGDALVKRGVISQQRYDTWRNRADAGDKDAVIEAAAEIANRLQALEVGAGNGYATAFGQDPNSMQYALAHGILAFSHRADLKQSLPDYRMEENGQALAKTPVGPMMLLYDSPRASGEWPQQHEYVFNVDDIAFHPHAVGGAGSQWDSVASLEADFMGIAERIKDLRPKYWGSDEENTQRAAEVRAFVGKKSDEIATMIEEMLPILVGKQRELSQARASLSDAEVRDTNWFFDSSEVNENQAKVAELLQDVEHTQGLISGMTVVLRMQYDPDAADTSGLWLSRLRTAAQDISVRNDPSPEAITVWEQEIRTLLREQEALKAEHRRAQQEQHDTTMDLENWDNVSSWLQDAGLFVDWVWGGVSAEGNLYRRAEDQTEGAGQRAQGMGGVRGSGERMVRKSVHDLLYEVDTTYIGNYDRYSVVKPARDTLNAVLDDINGSQHALERASHYIRYRDIVQMQLNATPQTVTELDSVYDGTDANGYAKYRTEWVTKTNPRWTQLRSELSTAESMTAYWSAEAEGKVKSLKAQIPHLKQRLDEAGFNAAGVDANVRDEISWFLGNFAMGGWFRSPFWSYDGSQVSGIQQDLSRLEGQLSVVRGAVEPEYQRYKGLVDASVAARRAEILQP